MRPPQPGAAAASPAPPRRRSRLAEAGSRLAAAAITTSERDPPGRGEVSAATHFPRSAEGRRNTLRRAVPLNIGVVQRYYRRCGAEDRPALRCLVAPQETARQDGASSD